MFSCFIDLSLPTLFSGYDLLDYSATRGLSPALNRDDSGCLGDRRAVVDSPAEPRVSHSSGWAGSIISFFSRLFSCFSISKEQRAAFAVKNGALGDGQTAIGDDDLEYDDRPLHVEFDAATHETGTYETETDETEKYSDGDDTSFSEEEQFVDWRQGDMWKNNPRMTSFGRQPSSIVFLDKRVDDDTEPAW